MNALRIRFKTSQDKCLLIQSTLDKSYWLNSKTDEEVQFDRNALTILKNISCEPVVTRIEATKVDRNGAGIVFRSTRRASFILGTKDAIKIKLQPGEVLQIRGEDAMDKRECPIVPGLTA